MCRPTTCKTCGRTTWAGCGQHVADVRAMVPSGQWCPGRHTQVEKAAARADEPGGGEGLLSRLFRR